MSRAQGRILAVADAASAAELLDATAEQLRNTSHGADLVQVLLDRCAIARAAGDRRSAGLLAQEAYNHANSRGAGLAAQRARAEMEAAGRRPRTLTCGSTALTSAEQRVAGLAASGLGNRQIAADLFVTRKTVEFHLSNVYRKLRIDGRAALRSRLPVSDS